MMAVKWLLFIVICILSYLCMCMLEQFAGLSSFPGLGMAQGLSNPMPFGQSFHPTGAFQPKVLMMLFCLLFALRQRLNMFGKVENALT